MDVGYRAAHASPFNTAAVTPHPGMGTQVHYLEDGTISEQPMSRHLASILTVCLSFVVKSDAHTTRQLQHSETHG